ncbi:ribosome small subunit-dependent GTPase A [Kitasatospora sp. NBC_01287]|uniref:ribosome small subunit-dependent GTPase A n=1 Tax=Kitasatospora sp. NBC_01287 TaxID=2903573 RepID=UPI0022567100|nr:ribosome small subunit-dependent GTPase A [Kitasatospora sp. NBC_01287]MCX4749778.1 ribosome small subunit-dependent GTPase A [Kitasatospora sp. NBC_01287]
MSGSSLPGSPLSGSPLAGYGWTAELAELFAPLAEAGLTPGRLARVDRGRADVLVADAGTGTVRTVRAGTRPVTGAETAENPCTGDWVALDLAAEPLPVVSAVLPRATAIIRKSAGKASEGQVLAANVDTVLIAVSLAVDPDIDRVERFVALAWESGAQPVVALTKADLVTDAEFIREDVERAAPGVTVLVVSAETGAGLDVLRACLGTTAALIGQSGAGKSTLTNALTGAEVMTVQRTRDADQKGRHTTTTRELFALPGGGVLIDTPGLRGVGLFGGEGLARAFAEIEELAERCRFDDCSHTSEPGCAVQGALADGTLAQRRMESYLKLQRENAWIASRTDARLAAERARVWKLRTKGARDRVRP